MTQKMIYNIFFQIILFSSFKFNLSISQKNLSLISLSELKQEEDQENDQLKEVSIKFDLSDPDITFPSDSDIPEEEEKISPLTSYKLPRSQLSKKGYTFSGWTPDFIYGYIPGEIVYIQYSNQVFKPVFVENNDKNLYTVEYSVTIEGKKIDTSEELPPKKYKKNTLVETSIQVYIQDAFSQRGWLYDGNVFTRGAKLVMPNHDIVLVPNWHGCHTITYYAGDLEGVVGNGFEKFTSCEGTTRELPEYGRFSRKGYKIIGWHCEFDGKDYEQFYSFLMPDVDVDFYAIWEPTLYTIVFKSGVNGIDNIKVKGKTGEAITIPEMEGDYEGYSFEGWSYEDKIYSPGEEWVVEGASPGLGIQFKAIWKKNDN